MYRIKQLRLLFSILCIMILIPGCSFFKKAEESLESSDSTALLDSNPQPYTIKIRAEQTDQEKKECDLASAMEKHSRLIQLKDKLPDGMLGLEGRARADKNNAMDLLHSLGYYDGSADFTISSQEKNSSVNQDNQADQVPEVLLTLIPGKRYSVGTTEILYIQNDPQLNKNPENKETERQLSQSDAATLGLPGTLESVKPNSPAIADNILSAVDTVKDKAAENGFPEAELIRTRYTIDKKKKTLNAYISINLGPLASMGDVHVIGAEAVSEDYIKKLARWKKGDAWDQRKIAEYRETLQKTGLFRSIEIVPEKSKNTEKRKDNEKLLLPVNVTVREGAFRSLSLSLRYATDNGFGLKGSWVHRNLFGSGEKLSIATPFTQDLRGIASEFEKPFFGDRERKFLMGASYLKEETDAYTKNAGNAYIGIEQKFLKNWKTSLKFFGEAGEETKRSKVDFQYGSVLTSLDWDTRDSLLDPKEGVNLRFELIPIMGNYRGSFFALSSKIGLSGYYPILFNGKVVLAGKLTLGSIFGADLINIPPSLRFYSGGAGSVRGYAKQKIGPQDVYGDPIGGRSFNEVSLEARIHITDQIGIVPFIDGGMIYEENIPKLFSDMQWAAGLGLRYYTSIGPIRLDVAFPLNKNSDDKGYQIYFSIGQAF